MKLSMTYNHSIKKKLNLSIGTTIFRVQNVNLLSLPERSQKNPSCEL